jgi:hypothetical protein
MKCFPFMAIRFSGDLRFGAGWRTFNSSEDSVSAVSGLKPVDICLQNICRELLLPPGAGTHSLFSETF